MVKKHDGKGKCGCKKCLGKAINSISFNTTEKHETNILNKAYNLAFNTGVESMMVELMGGDALDGVKDLIREMPIDYDSSTRMWDEMIVQIAEKIKK